MGETSQPGPRTETTSASTPAQGALDFRATPKEQRAERQQSPVASRPVSDGGSRAGDPRHRLSAVAPASRKWVTRTEVDRRARARLRLLEGDGIVVLDDRRVPGSRDSIKLIAVSCAGVFVIDTKHYKGLVHTMRPGSIGNLGPHELHVG
ncbi:MAG TPA: nuclease-related domain-containing protein, partial [Acidimicrobiales bacterium]|nr:nuclease-related domain-containing protein [Acidimicrobiales bacterium]